MFPRWKTVRSFVGEAVNHFGRLDHLVNNAGIAQHGFLSDSRNISQFTATMASKAALISFCETLSTEICTDVSITIVTPGFIKTELTQGEFQAVVNFVPGQSVQRCAKAIVKSACRGDIYLTEPSWMRMLYLCKLFFPEVIEWCNHFLFVTRIRNRKAARKEKIQQDMMQNFTQLQLVLRSSKQTSKGQQNKL